MISLYHITYHVLCKTVLPTYIWSLALPSSGMPCVAQHTVDSRWVRAKVENLPGKQMVDVRFVDHGNTERLWYHELYKILDEFLVLPIQV